MPRILHILTQPPDELVTRLVRDQQLEAANQVEVVDLTQPSPDYTALVEKVFAADSVASW